MSDLDPRNILSDRIVWEPTVVLTHYMQPNPMLAFNELTRACGADADTVTSRRQLTSTHLENLVELAAREGYASLGVGRDSLSHHEHLQQDMHMNPAYHAMMSFRISGVSRDCLHQLNRHNVGIQRTERSFRFLYADLKRRPVQVVMPPRYIITAAATDEEAAELRIQQQLIDAAFRASMDAYEALLTEGSKSHKRELEAARAIIPGGVATSQRITLNLAALINLIQKRASSESGELHADLEIARLVYKMWSAARPLAPNYLDAAGFSGPMFGPDLNKPNVLVGLTNVRHWK